MRNLCTGIVYRQCIDVYKRQAQAVTDLLHPDKINYLIFGDTSTHLHVHIVPKYRDGKDWGKVFLTDEPTPDVYKRQFTFYVIFFNNIYENKWE